MKTNRWKKLLDPATTAWSGVITHKLRSVLTMLGIVIGVGAVITLMSVGKGTTSQILESIQDMGSNLITISSSSMMGRSVVFFSPVRDSGLSSFSNISTGLTQEDADAIASEVENIAAVATSSSTSQQLIYSGTDMYASITGATPSYQQVRDIKLTLGSFFNEAEYERGARVAVIGAYVAQNLFAGQEAIGQNMRMGSTVFTVIGVLESSEEEVSFADSVVYIPLSTLQQNFSKSKTAQGETIVSSISLITTDEKYSEQAVDDITELLRERHDLLATDDDDFSITSMSDIIETFEETSATLSLLLGAIAGISLLVGGIGVMNIMLVSVLERTREIGIRKALGAREPDIWIQFLIEASMLTLSGGIIGVAAGWGISYAINAMDIMTTLVTADVIFLAVGVSVGIGLFFGFYPAWNAARLNPIEALRSE
jgi:putative ABC transport system permease protein